MTAMNATSTEFAIDAQNVGKSFGGVHAIRDVTYQVRPGTLTALIGPNGAGKSTLFNLLTNLYIADTGTIKFFGQDLAGMRSDRIARVGLIRTFQTARCFAGMSVLENVLAGAHLTSHARLWEQALWIPKVSGEERTVRQKGEHLLDILGLAAYRDEAAISLPLGLQKLLEIARALMARPKVLLLDEPAAGLNDSETQRLAELLVSISKTGLTIVVVEHNMSLVMSIAQHIVVLDAGRVIAEGTPAQVQSNDRVIEAYVGREADAVGAGR
jgi:branched-chain amino acid transport system ATP-binding protein